MHEVLKECEGRFSRIEGALDDDGSWGIKTKVAKMWDWWNINQGKQTKLVTINIIALVFSGLSSFTALAMLIIVVLRK